MTRTIIVNGTEFPAFGWFEAPLPRPGEEAPPAHTRDQELLEEGVSDLRPGEVTFKCDQTFVFDTTLEVKGDGRKFVIIASENGRHVAKPYRAYSASTLPFLTSKRAVQLRPRLAGTMREPARPLARLASRELP